MRRFGEVQVRPRYYHHLLPGCMRSITRVSIWLYITIRVSKDNQVRTVA